MRDWGTTIGTFGLLLLTSVATLCALLVVAASVYFLITEGSPGYALMGVAALGFACMFASGVHWSFTRMVEG